MKIEYINGDLFKTDIHYIAHGCNAQGVMGSGVAAIVRRDYPEAYKAYVYHHEHVKPWELGDIQFAYSNGKTIINAITQNFYGRTGDRFVDYDAVAKAMRDINRVLREMPMGRKVAMPQIGAGLGGGDWDVLAEIIEKELVDVQPVVYIL